MKSHFTVLLFLILINKQVFSQNLKIDYLVNHITDTTRNTKIEYSLILFANADSSYCVNQTLLNNDSIKRKWNRDISDKLGKEIINSPRTKRLSAQEVYEVYTYNNGSVLSEVKALPIGNKFLILDSNYIPSWTLINESKTILGLQCQKAETFYKGRKWVAFFAKEIPLQIGPWKFCKLPGAILEVTSSDGTISMVASNISKTNVSVLFKPSSSTLKSISNKILFYKHLKAYAADPNAYSDTYFNVPSENTTFSIPTNNIRQSQKISNNPIEPYE